ncbi:serine/threonine-protein kinase [Candidatus Uabimicrobium amorphum]|uniref:Protein kinase n=1 Tax=Uabimicrobium amorphum TaxID=2596890 RepID=A0A5S9F1T2_UABAM|nr:serine/threonine-protein kinase [Candidatus Uabimicrobium amorphum]BBM82896.1 protein kinase [Candidatus Uabimicrobium amorphum]
MQGKLILKNSDQEVVLTFKENDKIIIGRNKRCNLIVNDTKISSMHCQIDVSGEGCRFVDLGSTNGSYVNGNKTSSATLYNNDVIRLGNAEIAIEFTVDKDKSLKKKLLNSEITETWSENDLPAEEVEYIYNYRLLKTINDFGQGENYQAEHKTRYDIVALRKLPVSSSTNSFEKFAKSTEFFKSLDSARIIKTLDIFEENGVPIIVTEYIQGCTLEMWLEKKQRLSLSRSLKIAAYIASGIEYLHRFHISGICLCPHHIIVEELTKRTKIFDISCASFLRQSGYDTHALDVAVQKYYPKPLEDAQDDMYVLGTLLFFLLTGESPIQHSSPQEYLEQKRSVPPAILQLVVDYLQKPREQKIKRFYQTVTKTFHNLKRKER